MTCLKGTTVMCTGFPDQTRQVLQQLVVDLGGSYLTDCSTGARPDVLVACSVLSSKYKVLAAKSCLCALREATHVIIASLQRGCRQ